MKKIFDDLIQDPRFRGIRGVLLFIIITLGIHVAYKIWIRFDYFPITLIFNKTILHMRGVVFDQSRWAITHILKIQTTVRDGTLWFNTGWGIVIGEGCTGLKQMTQVLLLFLIYPGPWKHKLWFIPLGMVIIHVTNIIRISMLAVAMNMNLHGIHFIHDQILRVFFYLVIFAMWVFWEEKISKVAANG